MDNLLTVAETAGRLRVAKSTVQQMCREQRFPHLRIGDRILIPEPGLEAWVAANTVPARINQAEAVVQLRRLGKE